MDERLPEAQPAGASHPAKYEAPHMLEYMGPQSEPVKLPSGWQPSQAVMAAMLTIGSGLLGGTLNVGRHNPAPIFILPVVGGAAWYVIARLRSRKRTAMFWRIQLLLAACMCLYGTVAFVIVCEGSMTYELDHPSNRRAELEPITWGVGWFILAELGALVQRFVRSRRNLDGRSAS